MNTIKTQIADHTAAIMKEVITLQNEKEEMAKRHEKELDNVFSEFITVIDTFERSEQIIKEKKYDKVDEANKSIKRLLNAKKKALAVLEKFSVEPITFPDNQIIDDYCTTVATEPDSTRNTGDIISIERTGYLRKGRVIRLAEVVIVKN